VSRFVTTDAQKITSTLQGDWKGTALSEAEGSDINSQMQRQPAWVKRMHRR